MSKMNDLISRKGVSAWLYNMGHEKLSKYVLDEKRFPSAERPSIGRWEHVQNGGVTPGGTPLYACEQCGGSMHLHGAEYPERKVFCDECGSINLYPWEKCMEEIEDE